MSCRFVQIRSSVKGPTTSKNCLSWGQHVLITMSIRHEALCLRLKFSATSSNYVTLRSLPRLKTLIWKTVDIRGKMPSKKSGHFAATSFCSGTGEPHFQLEITRAKIHQHLPLHLPHLFKLWPIRLTGTKEIPAEASRQKWSRRGCLTEVVLLLLENIRHASYSSYIHFLPQACSKKRNSDLSWTRSPSLQGPAFQAWSSLAAPVLYLSICLRIGGPENDNDLTCNFGVLYFPDNSQSSYTCTSPALLSSRLQVFVGRQSNAPVAFRGDQESGIRIFYTESILDKWFKWWTMTLTIMLHLCYIYGTSDSWCQLPGIWSGSRPYRTALCGHQNGCTAHMYPRCTAKCWLPHTNVCIHVYIYICNVM